MKAYKNTLELLELLQLKGIAKSLDEVINEAEAQRLSYLVVVHSLLQAEITYRTERRFQRNLAAAHFPVSKSLDDFEFGRVKGITKVVLCKIEFPQGGAEESRRLRPVFLGRDSRLERAT